MPKILDFGLRLCLGGWCGMVNNGVKWSGVNSLTHCLRVFSLLEWGGL